jgi:hypothetical protein
MKIDTTLLFARLDKVKAISLLLNVLLLLTTGIFAYKYIKQPCPPCNEGEIVTVKYDTVYSIGKLQKLPMPAPKPFKSIAKDKYKPKASNPVFTTLEDLGIMVGIDSLPDWIVNRDPGFFSELPKIGSASPVVKPNAVPNPCNTVNFYADTIWQQYVKKGRLFKPDVLDSTPHVITNYQVLGEVLDRQVYYAPIATNTRINTTVMRRERVKLYIGGALTYNANTPKLWGAGPQACIAIPKVGTINYYYDVHNNAHTAGLMALIRFKK